MFASTLFIRGKSRMREIRSYGSVRGVVGNRYPYRDWSSPECLAGLRVLFAFSFVFMGFPGSFCQTGGERSGRLPVNWVRCAPG